LGKAVDHPQSLNHGIFFCPKSYQVIWQNPRTKADRPTQIWIRSVSEGDRFWSRLRSHLRRLCWFCSV